jgi:hypothetical protein
MRREPIILVLGYGCHLTEEVKRYLDAVAIFVNKHDIQTVMFSGGFTNRHTKPGVSEAATMADYLKESLTGRHVYLEEQARTTAENMRFSNTLLRKQKLEPSLLIIFCDTARRWKAAWLARWTFGDHIRIRCRSMSITRKPLKKAVQLLIATPLSLLAFWMPALQRYEEKRAEQRMDCS